MNRFCRLVITLGIAVFLFPVLSLAAQEKSLITAAGPAAGSPGEEADHDALRGLVPMYEQAVNQGKPELLKPYLDAEFSGVMVTSDEVDNFASLQDYWARIKKLIGESGTYRVKVNVADRALLSGDLAVAHGTTADEVITSAGKTFHFEGRWTAICRKRDGQWKVLRIHSSMDPVGNSFVLAAIRWASIVWGLIVGIAGLIVGWLLHRIISRRRNVANTPATAA